MTPGELNPAFHSGVCVGESVGAQVSNFFSGAGLGEAPDTSLLSHVDTEGLVLVENLWRQGRAGSSKFSQQNGKGTGRDIHSRLLTTTECCWRHWFSSNAGLS